MSDYFGRAVSVRRHARGGQPDDTDAGAETPGFRERFVERREASLPPWLDSDRFDDAFRLMVNTDVPESSWGTRVAVGDPVCVERVVER